MMNRHSDLAARADRIPFWLVLMCVSAVLWIALVKLVVPPIIESAFRGESLRVLNDIIEGRHVNPISYYLDTSR